MGSLSILLEPHESNVCEGFGKYPDKWTDDDERDSVKYQLHDGDGKEQSNEAQHTHTDIPDTRIELYKHN